MKFHLHTFNEEIKARKIRRALAIYVGFAIPAVGIANLLESRYSVEHVWFDRWLIILAFGFIFTAIAAWHHGKQKVKHFAGSELLIYAVLLLCLSGAVVFIPRGSGPLRAARTMPDKSVAVLPFQNFSDSKEDEFFSDGITEDILTQLSKIAELRVISRTTMMQYKGTKKTLQEIGRELNVGAILEGSVRRDRSRVRIVGQLIDAQSDEHLWAETFDHELKDVFAIQSQVAQQIARALRAVLSPKEEHRISTPPTANVEAYALYLQGRQHYSHYTPEQNEKAIEFFKQALALDTNFALAYAGLSDAYSQRVHRFGYTVDWLDSAVEAGQHAITLDPESAEGYKALGLAYDDLGRAHAALEQYEKAVEINPNFFLALRNIGLINYRTGNLDRGLAAAVKVVSLAPDDIMGYFQVGMMLLALDLDSAAQAWQQRGRRLDHENPFPLLGLGLLYLTRGDITKAREVSDSLLKLAPSFPLGLDLLMSVQIASGDYRAAFKTYERLDAGPTPQGTYLLLKLGKHREAQEMARETNERCRRLISRGGENPRPIWEGACAFAVVGENDSALAWMRNAIDVGWRDYRLALRDPLLSSLSSDRSFQALMEETKERVAEMRQRISHIPF
jgi:TolB-like protein/Flp pilus assembly protein TadD